MKNNIFLFLLGFLLITFSCRTEDEIAETRKETIVSADRISIFPENSSSSATAKGSSFFDYADAFAYLAQRADSLHETNFTGLVNTENSIWWNEDLQQNFILEATESYIEFRIHSQTVFGENNEKLVVFPRIENNMIVDLVTAKLSEEDSKLIYYHIDRNSQFYIDYLSAFQERYNETLNKATGKGVDCGFPNLPPCLIEEVVIIYNPPNPEPNLPTTGGGCGHFYLCPPDIDVGGSGSYPNFVLPLLDPCHKIKKIGKNQKTKDLMKDELKTKTGDDKEHGYVLNESNGNVNETYFQGQPGDAWVDIPLNGLMDGFIHSHYDGTGLSVLSLQDIFTTAYLYTNGYVNNINTFVVGMVSSGSQYFMIIDNPVKFGTFVNSVMIGNEINPTALNSLEYAFQNVFNIKLENNSTTNEQNFIKFLEKNNTGLKILKGSDDMNSWSSLNLSPSGTLIPINCP